MTFAKLASGLIAIIVARSVGAAEWAQFRGPEASGVDETHALPTHWDVETGSNILWQTAVPGLSHSSPIIWEDRIYLATTLAQGKEELKVGLYGDITPLEDKELRQWRLLALNKKNGKVVWNTLGYEGVPKGKRHPKSTHCNSTPATDGKHIVEIFGSEGLFCFDKKGKLLWKKDLGPMDSGFFMVPSAQWGFSTSPVIRDGKVLVLCDVLTQPFLAAFAIENGKELWRIARKDVSTWGTPNVVEARGRKEIVVNGWHETAGYDLATGTNLWRLDGGGDIPVPTPVFGHGLVYFTSAHGNFRPVRAIRPDAQGDITPEDPGQTNAFIAWAHARQGNYMQTPILAGNFLFACFDMGILTCFDAQTGGIKYSERLTTTPEGFTSSPVSDGRNLFFTSELGTVFVVPVSDKFSVTASNDLHETCMSTPAISNGVLFFRTRDKLIAIGRKKG
jgi:outer membrane protein assembly factor BamB